MTKVYYIGPEPTDKSALVTLGSRDRSVTRFNSLRSLMYRGDETPDVIIIDHRLFNEPAFKEFAVKYRAVPKLVFYPTDDVKGLSAWLKYPFTYPVIGRSARKMDFFIDKAVHEKKLIEDHSHLSQKMDAISRELAFFDEVSKILTSSVDLNDILKAIMKKVKKLLKAESLSVFFVDEEAGELKIEKSAGANSVKEDAGKLRLKIGEGIAGWVAQEGIPIVVPDVSADKRFFSRSDKESIGKTRSILCVPIKSKGSTLGVLEIINKTTNEPFTKDDMEILMRVVDQAAIAIERASLYQKMAELSITDDLTKLFNTRYLNRTLEIEVSRSDRHRSSLSLIFMDVDHFKTINDNYGHLVGSKLLVEMGQLLIKGLRTVDIVARYGGDEFVMVLPQTRPNAAVLIAERIRKTIEQNIFLKKEGLSLRLTASFGVASYPESAKSKEDLLRLADEAMYRVKYQTRNGVYAIV